MRKRKILILFILGVIGITSLLMTFPRNKRCNSTGIWTGAYEAAPGVFWYWTFIASPEDPNTRRSVATFKWLNDDPTLFGTFPDADYRSEFVGERIRITKNTWKATFIGYGVNKSTGEILYIMTYSETEKLRDNCKTLVLDDGVWALYLPTQDVNPKDGFPDDDQIQSPIASGPYSIVGYRMPIID